MSEKIFNNIFIRESKNVSILCRLWQPGSLDETLRCRANQMTAYCWLAGWLPGWVLRQVSVV